MSTPLPTPPIQDDTDKIIDNILNNPTLLNKLLSKLREKGITTQTNGTTLMPQLPMQSPMPSLPLPPLNLQQLIQLMQYMMMTKISLEMWKQQWEFYKDILSAMFK